VMIIPEEHLGKSGYKPYMKYKTWINLLYFWLELGSVTDGRPGPARQNGIPLMSSSAATRRRSRFCRARARDSRSALRACVRAPVEVLKPRSWGPNIEVLKPEILRPSVRLSRSWNSGPESQMRQHGSNRRREPRPSVWVLKPNRTCMASKIRFSG
jgi:hypothetical protein